jgi:Spy/CpxP family protein refolding chaperone
MDLKIKVMKAKILVIVLLMSLSAVLIAQTTENGPKKAFRGQPREMRMNNGERGPAQGLNLTDVQKEAFKQSMLTIQKQLLPLRNQLGEAEAHQKTLVTAEKPDLALINKNIEKIGAIKIEIAKIQTKNHLEMRSQLTDEQRLKFDLFAGKMLQQKGGKAMMHKMQMDRERSVN